MIQTLSQAKEYMIDRIQKVTGETVDKIEEAIVSTLLEEKFYEKIWNLVSEEEIESLQAENEEELEWKLFYRIQNYVSILEECTAEVLVEYLSSSVNEWWEMVNNDLE